MLLPHPFEGLFVFANFIAISHCQGVLDHKLKPLSPPMQRLVCNCTFCTRVPLQRDVRSQVVGQPESLIYYIPAHREKHWP